MYYSYSLNYSGNIFHDLRGGRIKFLERNEKNYPLAGFISTRRCLFMVVDSLGKIIYIFCVLQFDCIAGVALRLRNTH